MSTLTLSSDDLLKLRRHICAGKRERGRLDGMQEHVTLLPPDRAPADSRGVSASLPPDLLEQVRSRISVLALIILIAFSFDPLLYVLVWVLAKLLGYPAQFGNL